MNKFTSLIATLTIGCLVLVSPVSVAGTLTLADLIHDSSTQKIQSQRVAKAYFYLGNHIRSDKARLQINKGTRLFNHEIEDLKKGTTNRDVHDLLNYEEVAFDEFRTLVKAPYSKENARLVLDLSESLLEISTSITNKLQQQRGGKPTSIVAIAAQQGVLAQRVGLYYIAYRSGFRDAHSLHQLELAVKQFESAQAKLAASKYNNAEIKSKLTKVDKLWKVVRKFFLDAKGGGLPVTVFVTSDSITDSMNTVAELYVQRVDGAK